MAIESADRPVSVSVCGAFLPKEMLHVFRQVCAVDAFDHWVVTRRRENADLFPFQRVVTLRKSPLRGLHRAFFRLRGTRVPFSPTETHQLMRFTKKMRAAVVHVYLGDFAARALDYLARERAARLVSFHGGDLSNHLNAEEFRRLCACTDLFLARSESLRDALQQRGCPPERIRLNPTGIPLPTDFAVKRIPLPGRSVRMLQACRFIEKKGLDVTLGAVHRLLQAGRDVVLDLAGAGREEQRLRTIAAELGITERVHFLGFLDNPDLLKALPDYDVFVHPSRTTRSGDREGIPNSLLEAMANGVPVVATRHSGIPEAVVDTKNGLLIDRADPEALARAVERLLDHPDLYADISRAAHDTIAARFSISRCARTLEASYWEAMTLAQARPAARPRLQHVA